MARTKEAQEAVEAAQEETKSAVEVAKEEAKALVDQAKANEQVAREAAKAAEQEEKAQEKALKAASSGKTVKVRNRGIRSVNLISTEGTTIFVGPKARVEVPGDLVSESIRQQAVRGLIELEG